MSTITAVSHSSLPSSSLMDRYQDIFDSSLAKFQQVSAKLHVKAASSVPAIHQRTMDQLLAGLEGVMCYQDDVLIRGDSNALAVP